MEKDFDRWNIEKKRINTEERLVFAYPREVWWCSLGVNIGVETDGKNDNFERPVLILKKFNKDMFWVLPITSHAGTDRFHYPIKYVQQDRWVILSQIRTVSSKRLLRKIQVLSEDDFANISRLIKGFLP